MQLKGRVTIMINYDADNDNDTENDNNNDDKTFFHIFTSLHVRQSFLVAARNSIRGFVRPSVRPSVHPSVCPSVTIESKSGKTRISTSAHPSATDGRVSGLVYPNPISKKHQTCRCLLNIVSHWMDCFFILFSFTKSWVSLFLSSWSVRRLRKSQDQKNLLKQRPKRTSVTWVWLCEETPWSTNNLTGTFPEALVNFKRQTNSLNDLRDSWNVYQSCLWFKTTSSSNLSRIHQELRQAANDV